MTTIDTKITVRVQAKGGKFLGDDIGGALVTIRDGQTKKTLASGVTSGDSGKLDANYSANASQRAVITAGSDPYLQWLHATEQTSSFDTTLPLDRPTLLEVSAFGPVGGLQSSHGVTTATWVYPGESLTSGPGFVVELPGLLVQVMEPATHLKLPTKSETETKSKPKTKTVCLKANVTMMCGCPINTANLSSPEKSPWIPEDFDVFADIRRVGTEEKVRVFLEFDGDQPSLFCGSYEVKEKGSYEAAITAVQTSTGNTGVGQVTFTLPADA